MTNCVRDECSHLKIECCYEVSLLIKVGDANTRLAAGFSELLYFLFTFISKREISNK